MTLNFFFNLFINILYFSSKLFNTEGISILILLSILYIV
jgi:hypothetical protein